MCNNIYESVKIFEEEMIDMRKFVAFICATILVMAMSITAFAGGVPNPSVSATPVPDSGSTGNVPLSPSTGEPMMIMCAVGAVVVGTAGVVITRKKEA